MKTASNIKYFLKARNPKSLQREMLKNNIKNKSYFDYRIMFADGYWYAWYEDLADKLIKEDINAIESSITR